MKTLFSRFFMLYAFGLPFVVQAQLTYTTNSGAITITGYTGNPGALAIPSTINNLPVTSIEPNAFQNSSLAAVTIPNSMTDIGNSTFSQCYNLTNVMFPNSLASIGTQAFYSCSKLANIIIPAGVTNLGSLAFSQCVNLKNIYFNGNAPLPTNDISVFQNTSTGAKVYYLAGTSGWPGIFDSLTTSVAYGFLRVYINYGIGAAWAFDGGPFNTNVIEVAGLTAGNHTISFSPVNGWQTAPDQTFTVSIPATIEVYGNYVPQPSTVTALTCTAGVVKLQFSGTADVGYSVQSSTDLTTWTTLWTTNMPVGGDFQFIDLNPSAQQDFYRLLWNQ